MIQRKRVPIEPFFVTDSIKGTTADAYEDVLDWDVQAVRDTTIVLKNTDDSNALKYRLLVSAHIKGSLIEKVSEAELGAGEVALIQYVKAYARVVIQAKSSVTGSHASYQIDYIGLGV